VQETDVAVEPEQMRVRVQQECRIACFDSGGRLFAQRYRCRYGLALGGYGRQEADQRDEHFYGFGEHAGLLDKLAERKVRWTADTLDYGSMKCIRQFRSLLACVQKSDMAFF